MPIEEAKCYKCQQKGHLGRSCVMTYDKGTSKTIIETQVGKRKKDYRQAIILSDDLMKMKVFSPCVEVNISMISRIKALIDSGSCRTIIRKDQLLEGAQILANSRVHSYA